MITIKAKRKVTKKANLLNKKCLFILKDNYKIKGILRRSGRCFIMVEKEKGKFVYLIIDNILFIEVV